MKNSIYLLLLILSITSCSKNSEIVVEELPNSAVDLLHAEAAFGNLPTENDYKRTLPNYLGVLGMQITQADNLKAGLGRVLFYDKNLSKDRSVSCASCHKQQRAFSDNVPFSTGIEGRLTARNSQPLANVASFSAHYSMLRGSTPLLFWDQRAPDVSTQSRQTFGNPLEMGMEMSSVVERIQAMNYYPYLWEQVYGNFEPTEEQVLECLQEFVGSMGSHNSRLDRSLDLAMNMFDIPTVTTSDTLVTALYYGPGNDTTINTVVVGLPGLTESENRGRDIFVANCTKCHSPIRPFQEVFAACNGLEMEYKDKGLAEITGNPADIGVFKSPSLRNIALTAPYMHDGRFKTLREVIDFYSEQVQPHPNLHEKMKHGGTDPNLHLTLEQKQQLLDFLLTFTDFDVTSDLRFSNPFKR